MEDKSLLLHDHSYSNIQDESQQQEKTQIINLNVLMDEGDQIEEEKATNFVEPKGKLTFDMDEFNTLDKKITNGESNDAEEQRYALLAQAYA